MKLYFTRHGESEANTLGIISNRDLPHRLTEKGRLQASILAGKLQTKSITRIYSSPIPRAKETAEILARALEAPLDCVDALREPDCGVLEGRGDEAAWKEHDFWKESWFLGHKQDCGPKEGETCDEVRKRLAGFIESLIAGYGETQSEFLLVTHGALLLYGLPVVTPKLDPQLIWEHGLGHAVLITMELREGRLACTAWESL
jgi:broad specificity phosphatase PhoE